MPGVAEGRAETDVFGGVIGGEEEIGMMEFKARGIPAWMDVDTSCKEVVGLKLYEYRIQFRKKAQECPDLFPVYRDRLGQIHKAIRAALITLGFGDPGSPWVGQEALIPWDTTDPEVKEHIYMILFHYAEDLSPWGKLAARNDLTRQQEHLEAVIGAHFAAASMLGWKQRSLQATEFQAGSRLNDSGRSPPSVTVARPVTGS
jgi:hypothetical protein